ncbi:translocation and assembly module lipoprotein TamL [Prevotella sp.]|uniref:translocation and assembly module lipoprotein TamL n=1 Tax=Prevotella sp. TaxID=59823 RepID=UPI003F7F2D56
MKVANRSSKQFFIISAIFGLSGCLAGCSVTKFLPENEYLLNKVKLESEDKSLDLSAYEPYIRQKGNTKWFSSFRIPLATYSLAGKDSTKWINKTLKNIGEKPAILDTTLTHSTRTDLQTALQNAGYLDATVDTKANIVKKRKVNITYILKPGPLYHINNVAYDIKDDSIAAKMERIYPKRMWLKKGMPFNVAQLDAERKRITSVLTDNGYFHFHKDFISFTADSVKGEKLVNIALHLDKFRPANSTCDTLHTSYTIGSVNFTGGNNGKLPLRKGTLAENTWIEEGKPFCSTDLKRTYNSFGKLQAIRYTNIQFTERPDTNLLDCNIHISPNKPNSISFQPEGTNTAGDLGAAASLTYENRNLFHGSEVFSVKLRGAFEAITGLEGYQNQNYMEYGVESKLIFPSFVCPFLSNDFKRRSSATSEFSVSYNLQNRPEFHRRVFSGGLRYRWTDTKKRHSYKIDVIDLNYVYMPWISPTFKKDYLDNADNRNVILRYNYEDLFIMKIGFGMAYNHRNNAFKISCETAGNLLNGISHAAKLSKNTSGHYKLFNIAYAQYAKFDFDYTRMIPLDNNNQLTLHAALGVAYPYGNSTVLPFEKRYFSGGANSVRGWSVRGLGPGSFKGKDGAIDFINQTGDMKLDMNMEFRTFLFWKFYGAAFVDAGNIWTLRKYDEQPGGQFKLDSFYKQIAVAYGLGLRLNFSYFILRFDMGMKAINPAYETKEEHYPIVNPRLSRDFAFHFAVGLPF